MTVPILKKKWWSWLRERSRQSKVLAALALGTFCKLSHFSVSLGFLIHNLNLWLLFCWTVVWNVSCLFYELYLSSLNLSLIFTLSIWSVMIFTVGWGSFFFDRKENLPHNYWRKHSFDRSLLHFTQQNKSSKLFVWSTYLFFANIEWWFMIFIITVGFASKGMPLLKKKMFPWIHFSRDRKAVINSHF